MFNLVSAFTRTREQVIIHFLSEEQIKLREIKNNLQKLEKIARDLNTPYMKYCKAEASKEPAALTISEEFEALATVNLKKTTFKDILAGEQSNENTAEYKALKEKYFDIQSEESKQLRPFTVFRDQCM